MPQHTIDFVPCEKVARPGHHQNETYQTVNHFEVFRLHGVLCTKLDENWNVEYKIAITGCQYGAVFQYREPVVLASPLCATDPA